MVVKFDLSNDIPANVTVKEATLSLFYEGGTVGIEHTYVCHLTASWDAETVTWIKRDASTDWDPEGGEFDTGTETQTTYAAEKTWENYDVTDIVKLYVAGTPNHGFIMYPDQSDGNTGRIYYSSDYSSIDSLRPKLIVTYESTGIKQGNKGVFRQNSIAVKKVGTDVQFFVPFENAYRVELYSASGMKIHSMTGYGAKWQSLNSGLLAKGIYSIRVSSGDIHLTGSYLHID